MIKAIMLDFAGVVSTERCFPSIAQILHDRTGVSQEDVKENMYSDPYPYLRGEETTEEFWEKTVKDLEVPLELFREAFATWFILREDLINWVEEVEDDYRIILVSDNFDSLSPTLRNHERLSQLFDSMYFSNEMGMTKKEKEMFERVLEAEGLEPEACVFTDDKEKNLVAPASLGIHTTVFESTEHFIDFVESL